MKILHVNDHYEHKGGAETVLFHALSGLEERGIENVVVHYYPAAAKPERRSYEVPKLDQTSASGKSEAVLRYEEILKKENPDLIHLYDIGNPEVQETSLRFGPALQSVFNHSFYCPGGQKFLPALGRICQKALGPGCLAAAFLTHCNSIRPGVLLDTYQKSSRLMKKISGLHFLTISHYQSEALRQNGISPERIQCLAPFTDLPALKDEKESNPKEILFSGRIMPSKGLELLLQAMTFIRTPCVLVVDGDGPDLEKSKKTAARLKILDRVRFAGWQPPKEHWENYRRASLAVLPSIWPEPFGLVGIEAMSYGKPVVGFNVGGIPDWLEDGVTGFLIPPYDVRKMAEKIDLLLADSALARRMGECGRQSVEKKFSKKVYMDKLLTLYQDLIQRRTACEVKM